MYIGDDINSTITLTPSHFVTLNPKLGIPENEFDEQDSDYQSEDNFSERLLTIWKKGQKLPNSFWKIWRNEYLLSLRERTQTQLKTGRIQSPSDPSVGDIVLVKDDVSRGVLETWKTNTVGQES